MQPGLKLVPKVKLQQIPNVDILSKHIAEGGPTMYARRKTADYPAYKSGGTQVVGAQGAAVADATDAASVILRLNELLARCRAHGLITT